jgi:hypothetical protein
MSKLQTLLLAAGRFTAEWVFLFDYSVNINMSYGRWTEIRSAGKPPLFLSHAAIACTAVRTL